MYDLYYASKKADKTLKHLEDIATTTNDIEKLEQYAQKNDSLIDKASYSAEIRDTINEINLDRMDILKNKSLTGHQKKVAIDMLKREKNEILYQMHQEMKEEKKAKKGK